MLSDGKALANGKFRIMLSDGENFLMCMPPAKLASLVAAGGMCLNSLISIGQNGGGLQSWCYS